MEWNGMCMCRCMSISLGPETGWDILDPAAPSGSWPVGPFGRSPCGCCRRDSELAELEMGMVTLGKSIHQRGKVVPVCRSEHDRNMGKPHFMGFP